MAMPKLAYDLEFDGVLSLRLGNEILETIYIFTEDNKKFNVRNCPLKLVTNCLTGSDLKFLGKFINDNDDYHLFVETENTLFEGKYKQWLKFAKEYLISKYIYL